MKPISAEQEGKIPPHVMESLQMHLAKMQTALLAKDPEMPKHLQESHRLLITYPESTQLLDDAEIHDLIKAAEEHTKVRIVEETAKSKGRGSKKEVNAALDL